MCIIETVFAVNNLSVIVIYLRFSELRNNFINVCNIEHIFYFVINCFGNVLDITVIALSYIICNFLTILIGFFFPTNNYIFKFQYVCFIIIIIIQHNFLRKKLKSNYPSLNSTLTGASMHIESGVTIQSTAITLTPLAAASASTSPNSL